MSLHPQTIPEMRPHLVNMLYEEFRFYAWIDHTLDKDDFKVTYQLNNYDIVLDIIGFYKNYGLFEKVDNQNEPFFNREKLYLEFIGSLYEGLSEATITADQQDITLQEEDIQKVKEAVATLIDYLLALKHAD